MDLCYNYHSCADKTQKCIAAALNEERILLKKRTLKIPFILLISLLRLLGVREERGFRSLIRVRSFVRSTTCRSFAATVSEDNNIMRVHTFCYSALNESFHGNRSNRVVVVTAAAAAFDSMIFIIEV